jgi:hypothetical protein
MFQEQDVSVGAWFVFYILSAIPGVNVLVWLILLLGQNTNKSLKNLLVLQLILFVVAIVILILFWGAIFGSLLANA